MGFLPASGLATIAATARTITSLLGLGRQYHYAQLTLKANNANAGTVYFGGSNVSSTVYIGSLTPGSSYTFGPFDMYLVTSDEVYLTGTVNDIVQVIGVV